MDYFLRRDARCYKLISDSAEMAGKIESYKVNEALYKANEQDLKGQVSAQKSLVFNYKAELVNTQIKYTEAQNRAKFRGKVIIGSLSLNLALTGLVFVLMKL